VVHRREPAVAGGSLRDYEAAGAEAEALAGECMSRFVLLLALGVACAAAASCGYLQSGAWVDDQKNFARAWGYSKPDEINMVHSWYWRSAHFTREESYFFQFKWHDELFKQLVAANQMQPVERESAAAGPEPKFCFAKPGWFAPQERETYEAWRCTENSDCWLFLDRRTKDIFIYACQM
jgi:hypothetical protein